MERFLIQLRKTPLLLFGVLTAVAVLVSFLIANAGMGVGIAILLLLGGICAVVAIFHNYKNGFLMLVVYSFFFFEIGRILAVDLPFGVLVEVFLALIFFSILSYRYREGVEESIWDVFKNPIGVAMLIYAGYAMLEMFNPFSHSISSRMVGIRETTMVLLIFICSSYVFTDFKYIKFFTKFWLFFALLAALYGIYQEKAGMPKYAMAWLMKGGPEAFKLAFIWGHLRVWSFMSDINGFGLFMAFSGIICFILALGPFKTKQRVILVISGMLMLVSMSYSGTRTATAMVLLGFAFYVLMTINRRVTMVFAIAGALGFAILMFGPFYAGPIQRMRSTFKGSEDASMNVREQKRLRLQPRIHSHPIGWGLNTVGNVGKRLEPGHPLAGPYDTDSGYLKVALERGWIGLLLILSYYATAMIVGINNYFKAERKDIKIFYAAYLAAFLAISVAHFAQDATDQKPIVIIIIASFVFFIKMIKFDKPETTN